MNTEMMILLLGALALLPLAFNRRQPEIDESIEQSREHLRSYLTPADMEEKERLHLAEVEEALAHSRNRDLPKVVGFHPEELEHLYAGAGDEDYGSNLSKSAVLFENDSHDAGETNFGPEIMDPDYQALIGNIPQALALGYELSPTRHDDL